MLFSTRPKEDRKDLYDREKEIEMIKDSINRKEWLAVLGIKRIGKTSIVNVATKESNGIALQLNIMRLYDPKKKRYKREDFMEIVLNSVNETIKRYTLGGRIIRFISNVLGIDQEVIVNYNLAKIRPKLKKFRIEDLTYLFRELNDLARDNNKVLIIVFDEAQELLKVNMELSGVFHDIYEYCTNSVIIFTGSMIRLVEDVLSKFEYKEPLFGRYIRRVQVPKFTEEQSRDFLERGFEEEGISVSNEVISEAINEFDGIPGWLTLFGSEFSFAVKHGVKPDIKLIKERAINEVKEETKNFLRSTQSIERYSAIILSLDRLGGKGTLNEITKVSSSILGEDIPEPRVYDMVNRLLNYGFVEKCDESYCLPKDKPSRVGEVLASKDLLSLHT
ncbi:MAG: ATP-binding protein [Sulfolobus sp.]|nr:ATP-binding protein [Sulfolobus sp.]